MASTTVKDIMTSQPTSVRSDEMVVDAARRMLSDDVGSLPVVDGNRVVGMITDRDLVLQVVAKDLDPHKIRISDICSERPTTAEPDEPLDDALQRNGGATGSTPAGRHRRQARGDHRPGGRRPHGAPESTGRLVVSS